MTVDSKGVLVRRGLTPKRARILRFIRGYIAEQGYSPSLEEIADAFGYRSLSTVHEHIARLRSDGYLLPAPPNSVRALEIAAWPRLTA